MKNLIRLTEPFGVIEKLMQTDSDSAGLPVLVSDSQQAGFDVNAVADLLRNFHERQQGNMPATMDAPGSVPTDYLEHSGTGRFANELAFREQGDAPDHSKWSTVQQELRLWCLGDSTGGKFVVINETDVSDVLSFECVRPIGVSPESWSGIDVSLDTDALELAPLEQAIVSVRINFKEFRPAAAKLEFCLDIRGASGSLVSKLWIEVTFPSQRKR